MIPDTLYAAAIAFRKTKLWNQLYDSQIFALRHTDGTIGYCCIMGMMGEHLALAVYPGEAGLAAYRRMSMDRDEMDDLEDMETSFSQNCVMCSFEAKDDLRPKDLAGARAYAAANGIAYRGRNAYPQFQRFRPGFYPWYLTDATDQAHLLEALSACMEVSKRLASADPETIGFVDAAPFDHDIPLLKKRGRGWSWGLHALPADRPMMHPTAVITDELRLERIRKAVQGKEAPSTAQPQSPRKAAPKRGAKSRGRQAVLGNAWACDVVIYPNPTRQADDPISEESGEEPMLAPFFPTTMIVIDNQTGFVLHIAVTENAEGYTATFGEAFLRVVEEHGAPKQRYVQNDRAFALLTDIAQKLSIPLTLQKPLPVLAEALAGFYAHVANSDDDDFWEIDPDTFVQKMCDPAFLASLPDDVLQHFIATARTMDTSKFPAVMLDAINAELRKRS